MSHVLEEHLEEYRRRRDFFWRADSLGNQASGCGQYSLANQLWQLAAALKGYANELRQ